MKVFSNITLIYVSKKKFVIFIVIHRFLKAVTAIDFNFFKLPQAFLPVVSLTCNRGKREEEDCERHLQLTPTGGSSVNSSVIRGAMTPQWQKIYCKT